MPRMDCANGHCAGRDDRKGHTADAPELSGHRVYGRPPDEIGGEIEASIPQEIREAEDTAWMAELGVQWTPETEEL